MAATPDMLAATPDLRERLRLRTADAHRALEASLDLLGRHANPARLGTLLGRFHGFHAAWEPALAARLGDADFTVARARMPALREDLLELGMTREAIDALPRCDAAARLVDTEARALGSLYVMEGSTLGGKLITRHLSAQPWWPSRGLRYFDPYGTHVGQRWRETLARLQAAPASDHERLLDGAEDTFRLLHRWLVLPSYTQDRAPAA